MSTEQQKLNFIAQMFQQEIAKLCETEKSQQNNQILFGSRIETQDSGFKIQKEKYENAFQKKHQILENQIMCPQQSYYKDFISYKKFTLSNAGAFHENSLSVVCCIFGMLEIRTLTPNRFKNQSSDTLNILGQNYNH